MNALHVSSVARQTGAALVRGWRIVALAVVVLTASGCDERQTRTPSMAPTIRSGETAKRVAYDRYGTVLAKVSLKVREEAAFARAGPHLVQRQVAFASRLVDRGRLTGSLDDYGRAAQVLESVPRAARTPEWHMLRAGLYLSMHQVSEAEQHLNLASAQAGEDLGVLQITDLLRGDVALQSGRYDAARQHYDAALARDRSATVLIRIANLKAVTGKSDEADGLYAGAARAVPRSDGRRLAWLELQRAVIDLDAGLLEESRQHLDKADAYMPGWWLVEEHRAEVYALQGDRENSRRLYRRVLEQTDDPAFEVALAELVEPDERVALLQHAREEIERRLEDYPTATAGHAVSFFIDVAPDPERAVRIAEADALRRPGGTAKINLARAYLAVGRAEDALRLATEVTGSERVWAEAHVVASQAAGALGDDGVAARHRQRAREINPLSVSVDP